MYHHSSLTSSDRFLFFTSITLVTAWMVAVSVVVVVCRSRYALVWSRSASPSFTVFMNDPLLMDFGGIVDV